VTDWIGRWIASVAASALISAIALGIAPKGRVHSVLRLVCGVVMVIALVSPVLNFNLDTFSLNAARYRQELSDILGNMTEAENTLTRTIIEDECAAYILDKAQVIGLSVQSVSVTAKWGDEGYFYPYETRISALGDSEQKGALQRVVEGELGIPPERLYWNGSEE
jgi:stage III sporulation protein AF